MAAATTQTNKSRKPLFSCISALLGVIATLCVAGNASADADSDWLARSTASGVVMATRFDTLAEVSNDTFPDSTGDHVSWETNNKASGNGSLRMDILKTDRAASGSWVRYLADDQREFGPGATFYVQYRQYFPAYLTTHAFAGTQFGGPYGGGWKQSIISNMRGSNQLFEVVLQNTSHRGFIQGYNRDTGGNYLGWSDFFNGPCNSTDYIYQNMIDRGGPETTCLESRRKRGGLYSQSGTPGSPDPETGAFLYYPDEWLTFQIRVSAGTFGAGVSVRDTKIQVWAARASDDDYTLLTDKMVNLGGNNFGAPYYFDAIWLLPYHTNRSPEPGGQDTYVLYDEVIVSSNFIPAPGATADGISPAQITDLSIN